jgi:hypothetical protein
MSGTTQSADALWLRQWKLQFQKPAPPGAAATLDMAQARPGGLMVGQQGRGECRRCSIGPGGSLAIGPGRAGSDH